MKERNYEIEKRLVSVVPSDRQLKHQQREFYAFVHFTVNTFTGKEWGDGTEDEKIFNPEKLDAKQWAEAVKSAGMKGIILTCKHHDGFCLWPSKYTKHTVANSSYKDGKGDVVKEVSLACKEYGLDFGVYLSPWDRNNELYGKGKAYDDYFIKQLEELLTGYGEVFSVWFDGACGEGPNGKVQYYDWDRYYETIRRLMPGACIHVCGPDVRWCGNEAGHTREAEWSVVPLRTKDTEKIAEKSQHEDETDFREREIHAQDKDLGSYDLVKGEKDFIWYPAEVNTSIRPGWFYHEEEDDKVRSAETLLDIYEKSVGGNGTFLLNIPPTKEGLFHENDVKVLRELGDSIQKLYGLNLMEDVSVTAVPEGPVHTVEGVFKDEYESWYQPEDLCREAVINIMPKKKIMLNRMVLKENIKLSQRIEAFEITVFNRSKTVFEYKGSVIGYKKIVKVPNVVATKIEIKILESRVSPTLSFIGLY